MYYSLMFLFNMSRNKKSGMSIGMDMCPVNFLWEIWLTLLIYVQGLSDLRILDQQYALLGRICR